MNQNGINNGSPSPEEITTDAEHLGGVNWRIYVTKNGVKFSLVIRANGKGNHEQILEVFRKHTKQFDIEI